MTCSRLLALICVALLVLVAVPADATPGSAARQPTEPGPVLIVSAPGLRWADLAEHDLPVMEAFLARSSVAMLSLRTLGARTSIGEGYATIGSGNRASAGTAEVALALEPHERFEGGRAVHAYERRTGATATGEVLQVGFPAIERTNDRFLYGAEPGALGASLADAGHRTAVIANGDLGVVTGASPPANVDETDAETGEPAPVEEDPERPAGEEPSDADADIEGDEEDGEGAAVFDPQRGRAAFIAGMERTGQIPLGTATGLLRRDVDAPYGVRYDSDAVVDAYEAVRDEAHLTIVELSDLDRADGYRSEADGPAGRQLWSDALASSDELFGRLLDAAAPDSTVMLVTPVAPRAAESLGVFAISDGAGASLAKSGSTRRSGYVSLPDIAPTVLQHFDIDQPTSMTGAPVSQGADAVVDQGRFERFADTTSEAIFRDEATGPVSVVFVIAQILAYALAAVAVARRRRWTRPVSFLALVILATPPVAFLAGLLHVDGGNVTSFVLAIFGAAIVLAAVAEVGSGAVAKRWPRTRATLAPLVLVALTWTVLVVDVVTGGRLQINTVFGYSPLVAGRFAGYGNLAFALVGVGAVVVACGAWATWRLARQPADGSATLGGRAVALVVAFLAVTVVVDGAPMWGSDVGGVLATVPAFAVVVLVAMGVRIGLRRAVLIGVATAVTLAVFAAIDLARPDEDRTHLGRLVTRVVDSDGGGFAEVVQRKLSTNFSILTSSVWTLTIPFALGLMVFLALRRTGFLRDLQEEVPGIRPMLAGGLLVAFLGFALNDSGVAVPAMMFAVLLPYLTYVLLRWEPARR